MADKLLDYSYDSVLLALRQRLTEGAPGYLQIIKGPRQVGKTTLLLEIEKQFGECVLYAAADSPEAAIPGWWETIWANAEILSQKGRAILIIDEIQYLSEWGRRLKAQIDKSSRLKKAISIVVSGSSSLLLGKGSREAMTGRFEVLRMSHWPVRTLCAHFGLDPATAVAESIETGTFPGAVKLLEDRRRWQAYIRDSIIEPSIGKDILLLESVKKPALLRQLFAVAANHPAEIIAIHKICAGLLEKGSIETVANYLHLLQEASLVAALPKYTPEVTRQRASPPKLVVLNQAYLGAMQPASQPLLKDDLARFGRWVENACIAAAWNAGQAPYYWREEPYEVDMVLDGDWGKWAIEVKTGQTTVSDCKGLFAFMQRHSGFRPLVLCDRDRTGAMKSAGVNAMAWQDFLLDGL